MHSSALLLAPLGRTADSHRSHQGRCRGALRNPRYRRDHRNQTHEWLRLHRVQRCLGCTRRCPRYASPLSCQFLFFVPSASSDLFCSAANLLSASHSLPYVAILFFGPLPTETLTPFESWLILPLLQQDGSTFMGERLTVQFARGSRHRENGGFQAHERSAPRPRRTPHRMQISGLPTETSWQVCSSSYSLLPDVRILPAATICVFG